MVMKKFINDATNIVQELLEGYALAFPEKIRLEGDYLITRAKPKEYGKVGLVSLGGSGHEPSHIGYVGFGLLDVCVPGDIFIAPGPHRCLDALKRADRGAGILLIVGNHPADLLTSKLTLEMANKEGLNVKMVLNHEDIASGSRSRSEERRGLVGFLPLYKVAGAAAEEGRSFEEVTTIAKVFSHEMCTLAVAVSPATHPLTGSTFFEIGEDEMDIGMGSHGEAGMERLKMMTADDTAQLMLERLLEDLDVKSGQDLLVILSGAGATTLMELFIVFRKMHQILTEKKIRIARSLIDEVITTQEQAGFQMFIARVNKELLGLWDAPCDSPYFTVR